MDIIKWALSTLIASLPGIYALKKLRLDTKKEESSQARKVTSWTEKNPEDQPYLLGIRLMGGVRCYYKNSSEECLYNLFIFVSENGKSTNEITPDFFESLESDCYLYKKNCKPKYENYFVFENSKEKCFFAPQIFFTDADNVQWVRHPGGELKKFKYMKHLSKTSLLPNDSTI